MRLMPGEPHIARRMRHIAPFHVMDLLARAQALEAEGRDIVHMEVGEPDFPTPEPIVAAGHDALAAGHTKYTPAVGLAALREAIAESYDRRYGVDVDPGRIIVTPGASGALLLTLGVLIDPGDQILMADPGYPCNRHFARVFEGEALMVPVDAATDYQLTGASVRNHWTGRSVAVLVASPANPTGTLIPRAELTAIDAFVSGKGGATLVDEIYHGLVYDGEAATALSVSDQIFVINSFSKYFGMTGWRLGWIVAPRPYVRELDKLAQNLFLAAPTLAQHAALAAFAPQTLEIVEQRREIYRQRRDFLIPALRELGFGITIVPQGAFYIYADCTAFTDDSFRFSRQVLEDIGVAITPGIDFGDHRAREHVRFAYTTSLERLEEGVERLRRQLR
jgi:aspartate/methionine/tyrosine aminotransferase